jgi:acyl-CoA synthetase (AMP-forming)/AMP-acid ligase II
VSVAPDLLRYLHRGEPFSSEEWKDGSVRLAAAIGCGDGPTLFVPICMNASTIALMTLGPKRSGRPYDAHDRGFLRTAANQIALALTNAIGAAYMEQLETNRVWLRAQMQGYAASEDPEIRQVVREVATCRQALTAFSRLDRVAGDADCRVILLTGSGRGFCSGLDLSSLKICMSGGAPLPVEVQQSFEKLTGATLIEGYGLTETSPTGAICPVDKSARRVGSCGVPMPGTVIEIRDMENGERVLPAGKDNVGEVCIIGPQVMKGYWKQPDETDKVLFSHPSSNWKGLRTGDMGYMDADGWLFLVDRSKDLILSSGYNVYPRMIEEAVYEHPAVDECIVIGIPHPHRQEAPKVFVKLKPGAALTFEELLKHLDGKIGKHEMPIALEIRPELPKTPVGKLSKKELKEEERAKAQAKAA